jgi:hypothetical protein
MPKDMLLYGHEVFGRRETDGRRIQHLMSWTSRLLVTRRDRGGSAGEYPGCHPRLSGSSEGMRIPSSVAWVLKERRRFNIRPVLEASWRIGLFALPTKTGKRPQIFRSRIAYPQVMF